MSDRTIALAGTMLAVCALTVWFRLRYRLDRDDPYIPWGGFDWFGISIVATMTAPIADMALTFNGWR